MHELLKQSPNNIYKFYLLVLQFKCIYCLYAKNRFYSRESGLLSFCLYTSESKGPTLDRRRLVAFTFHPTDPFAISVQRDNFEYVVNFHLRKVYMPE